MSEYLLYWCISIIHWRYPELVTVYSIGKSVENRHLWVTRISTEVDISRKLVQKRKQLKPMVKIVANMHGNEVIIGPHLKCSLHYGTFWIKKGAKNVDFRNWSLKLPIFLHFFYSSVSVIFEQFCLGDWKRIITGINGFLDEDVRKK